MNAGSIAMGVGKRVAVAAVLGAATFGLVNTRERYGPDDGITKREMLPLAGVALFSAYAFGSLGGVFNTALPEATRWLQLRGVATGALVGAAMGAGLGAGLYNTESYSH